MAPPCRHLASTSTSKALMPGYRKGAPRATPSHPNLNPKSESRVRRISDRSTHVTHPDPAFASISPSRTRASADAALSSSLASPDQIFFASSTLPSVVNARAALAM